MIVDKIIEKENVTSTFKIKVEVKRTVNGLTLYFVKKVESSNRRFSFKFTSGWHVNPEVNFYFSGEPIGKLLMGYPETLEQQLQKIKENLELLLQKETWYIELKL
jgi:hypothetical protein